MSIRNRISSQIIGYGLYLYFLGLSFRRTTKALSFLKITKISHVSIWKWIQKYRPWKYLKKRKIKEYIIYETAIKAGSGINMDLGLLLNQQIKKFFHFIYQKIETCLLPNEFCLEVINKYGLHSVSSDGDTWYPQECKFLETKTSSSLFF